jgi:hypothetical protein
MLTAVAPVLERTTFLVLYAPETAAFAAKRTRSVPVADPLVCVKVAVEPYVVPSAETSNPVGAVATKFAVKLLPETLKDCAVEAVPYVVVKAVAVAVPVIVGELAAETATAPNPKFPLAFVVY